MQQTMFHKHAGKDITNEDHKVVHLELAEVVGKIIVDFSLDESNVDKDDFSLADYSIKDLLTWGSDKCRMEDDAEFVGLYRKLDEAVADWVLHQVDRNGVILARTNIADFCLWVYSEKENPTDIIYLPPEHKPLSEEEQRIALQNEALENQEKIMEEARNNRGDLRS